MSKKSHVTREEKYESLSRRDVPAVVFPVGAIVRKGKLLVYAGSADKYTILLSCKLDNLVNYLWRYCRSVG